jgi:hypothetical protein
VACYVNNNNRRHPSLIATPALPSKHHFLLAPVWRRRRIMSIYCSVFNNEQTTMEAEFSIGEDMDINY